MAPINWLPDSKMLEEGRNFILENSAEITAR